MKPALVYLCPCRELVRVPGDVLGDVAATLLCPACAKPIGHGAWARCRDLELEHLRAPAVVYPEVSG